MKIDKVTHEVLVNLISENKMLGGGKTPSELNGLPTHYRYRDCVVQAGNSFVIEEVFYPIRETKACFYLISKSEWDWFKHRHSSVRIKRVMKQSRVSYAYPSKDEAMTSFVIRKERQVLHSKHQAATAGRIVRAIKAGNRLEFINGMAMVPRAKPVSLVHSKERLIGGGWYPVMDSHGDKACMIYENGTFSNQDQSCVCGIDKIIWIGNRIEFGGLE